MEGEIAVEHVGDLDFLPVVVLGVDPEDGDGGDVLLEAQALGQLDRRQRLDQRVQRPAEQPGLLAGDHGHRLRVAQLRRGGHGLGGRAAPALLGLQNVRDGCAVARPALRPLDRVAPCRRFSRVAREELRHPRVVVRVVRRQTVNPGKSADVEGKPCGRTGHA